MDFTLPGRFKTADRFREHWHGLGEDMDCALEPGGPGSALAQPLEVEHADGTTRRIGNRFCVHPMEGWDGTPLGGPTENTLRRWRHFGSSGAKLVWGGEAYAVQPDGRANPNQLCMFPGEDNEANLAQLLDALKHSHQEKIGTTDDLMVGLQLTHSGRFCRPEGEKMQPRIAEHNQPLAEKYGLGEDVHVLSDEELRAISANMVRAAELAADVGFDFVDVKCCHGYLLHELLGARTRKGDFGGSFEHRTRMFRETVEAIRASRPDLLIGCRVSITDLYPFFRSPEDARGEPRGMEAHLPWSHGFGVTASNPIEPDFEEPVRFLELCRSLGLFMANLTIGSPYYCPHLQRPASYPPSDGYLPPRDPMLEVARHLRTVRTIRGLAPGMPVVGSGYSYLQQWLPNVAEFEVDRGHVDMVGLGRSMLSYPHLPADVVAGNPLERKFLCRTFSDCTTAPRNGMISGCYPLDPHYKAMPQAAQLRILRKEASRTEKE